MIHLGNKGFAISSIVYSILILFIILLSSTLTLLSGRKTVLDKSKNEIMKKVDSMEMESSEVHNYTTNGLVIHYDGIQNTRSGTHNASATRWENLVSPSHDGVLNGFTTNSWVEGKGLSFDGIDDFVNMGLFDTVNPGVTLEIVVKYPNIKNTYSLISNYDNGGYALEHQYDLPLIDSDDNIYQDHSGYGNNALTLYNQTTSTLNTLASPYESKANQLYTITSVIDNEGKKIYLYENGEQYSVVMSSLNLAPPQNNTKLAIGARLTGDTPVSALPQFLNGTVYSVRVYDRPLSNLEVYKNHSVDQKRFS